MGARSATIAALPTTLREGKTDLRHARRLAPLEEKLRDLCRLQHLVVPIIAQRRALRPHERPWAGLVEAE